MKMIITKHETADGLTVAIEGRVTAQNSNELGDEVKSAISGTENLVFDFDKLEYISSSGLRVLLFAQKEMNKRGKMSIVNVSPEVYDVLKAIGFTGISDIFLKE